MEVYIYNSLLAEKAAVYVGSTTQPSERHSKYRNMHFKGQKSFYRWANKNGINNMQLIKIPINTENEKELRLWEGFYIGLMGSYVKDDSGIGLNLIKIPSQNPSQDEYIKELKRKRFTGDKNPMYGKKHKLESIKKMCKGIVAYKVKTDGIQGQHKYFVNIISSPIYFNSIRECAKELNVERRVIQRICNGIGKSSKGYTFKYS